MGTENRLSELRNGLAGRTVTGVTDRHSILGENKVLALTTTCVTDRRSHDGPSQVTQSQLESDFFTRFKGRFETILSLIIDFVGLY